MTPLCCHKLLACNSMSTTASKQRTATAIRFPDELHDQLKAAAEERDLSINYLVVKAVEQFLPRLIPANELTLTRAS
jgi:predicted HicB family RNase H-like nuclease